MAERSGMAADAGPGPDLSLGAIAAGPAASQGGSPRVDHRTGPASVLLLSAWIGLVAGLLDLVLLVFKKRLIDDDFYRLGEGFPWIVPAGVAVLVLIPGAVLAIVARLRRGGVPLGIAVGLPSFVGFLDLSAKLPLEFWASLLFSGGLVATSIRIVRRYSGFPRLVRRTLPLLAGVMLILFLSTTGARMWSEHRAVAALSPPPPGARNVLLIVWDTVRARDVSLSGYGRRTTPNLERLAARGVQFRHAFATASWTLPSHASLFTGRWPHELSAGWKTPLDAACPTLAGVLTSQGYDTAGFVGNLDYCSRETGLGRGFAHYEDYPLNAWEVWTRYIGLGRRLDPFSIALVVDKLAGRRPAEARPLLPISKEHAKGASDVDREFLAWLSWQRPRGRPFFAFLNYNDAHTPYEVPEDEAPGFGLRPSSWHDRLAFHQWNSLDKMKVPLRRVNMARDVYDDSIAYLDRRLAALLEELDRRGVLDDTVVIVTSDHGEHLGDHGLFFHGCSLYRQVVEVPLVIAVPRGIPAGLAVAEPVSLRDIPATVLDLLGLDGHSPFPGRSLARFWTRRDGEPPPTFEPPIMETDRPVLLTNQGREPAAKGPMQGMVAGGMHYIRSGNGHEELYALESDPEEMTDAAALPAARSVLDGFRRALRSTLRADVTADRAPAALR